MKNCFSFLGLLLFVFVVLVLFVNSSSCYALSYEDIKEYVNYTASYYPNNINYQYIKNGVNSQNFETYCNNNSSILGTYNNFYIYIYTSGSARYFKLDLYNANSWNVSSSTVRYTGPCRSMHYSISSLSVSQNFGNQVNRTNEPVTRSYDDRADYYNNLEGMNYTYQDIQTTYTTPITYVGMQAIPQWTYLEWQNLLTDSTYNGNLFTYYYYGNMYNFSRIKLGHVVENDSYYYEIYLREYSTNLIKGEIFTSLNPYYPYYNGALYEDDQQNVYVNTLQLDYNKQYILEIISYYGTGGSDLYEDDDFYLFLPSNAVLSGDSILSYGSGDFTIKDNTNQIINNDNQNTNNIIQSITNYTPMSSGEILSGIVAYEPYSYSGDVNFFNDILQHVSQIFLDDTVHYIDIPIPMTTSVYRLYNNYWVTYNYLPELAVFISSAWWFLIFYIVIKKWSFVVDLIKVGDFRGSYQRNLSIKEDFIDARCDNKFCFFNTKCNC